jgi:hypothetical protein
MLSIAFTERGVSHIGTHVCDFGLRFGHGDARAVFRRRLYDDWNSKNTTNTISSASSV